ncbi:AraC family transcriptional regulator [Curtobacterium sp. AB7]|uniref:AraC family transcriptional regulator n=1 Tax=Curtobacterium sp. AB7 TaxID=3349327 RepID=UPI003839059F
MTLSMDRPGGRYSRRVVGTDVDQALAFFGRDYDFRAPAVRRTRPTAHWDFAGVGDDLMSLRSSRFMVDLRSESQVDDEFLVAWMRSGSSQITCGGETWTLEAGVPVVLPFAEPYSLHHRDIALNLVHLDRDFVRSLVGEDDFAFESMQRPTAAGTAVWQDVVRTYSSTWLDVDHDLDPIAQRDIAEAFATAAIRAFPQRDRWRSTVAGGGPEHGRVRRALDFVHEHAREPIGTPEIAAAAGLSPRGLQQSLRRHLDQTPGDLLRGVRLDGARADLLGGTRDETSVADVARSWGFGHLGRFSATYRARFGELPSESLRTR